ncbi:MAG: PPOX class F420-dependent oxidoreductase [Actinomycetota bacterium]
MDIDQALDFIRANSQSVLATTRGDGRPQLSPVNVVVDDAGRVVLSSRATAVKVKNLRRTPHASVCVMTKAFYGEWCQVEGPVTIIDLPEAMEGLVDYYRRASGEHPDWDDYRAAMIREQRVLVVIDVERAGPSVSG